MEKDFGNRKQIRVLRIAHSSLTPALRERERALVRCFPNVDLQVLTTEKWREAEVEVAAAPDDLFKVRTASTHLSQHIQLFAYDPRPLIRALLEHKPHLIDMNHESYSVACAEVLSICKWYSPQTPIIMQANQNIFRHYPPPFNWLERRALRRVVAAYVCSETVGEVLRAKGFAKPISLVPFGVDLNAFQPRTKTWSNSVPTIGFVGRMLPGKGLNVLAEALTKIKEKAWRLLVVGDGPERADFTNRLANAGLLDRAEFTGAISYELTPAYFQKLDLLVIPTETTDRIREQFGRVIVEGMASGVPVIGSTCGAIPEVIGDAGLVFPEKDATELATAISRMLDDPGLRQQFSRAGRKRVEENYSWDSVAHKTYRLYEQILNHTNNNDSAIELAA